MANVEQFPVIDQKVIQELQSIMDDEFNEVLRVFLEDSLSLMTDIHTGFENQFDQVLVAIYKLKSTSNNMGARRLAALSQRIETLIQRNETDAAVLMLDELQDTFLEAHAVISEMLNTGAMLSQVK